MLCDGKGGLASPVAGLTVTKALAADGKASGSAGCGSDTSTYQADRGKLRITRAAATRRRRADAGVMEQEQVLFKALEIGHHDVDDGGRLAPVADRGRCVGSSRTSARSWASEPWRPPRPDFLVAVQMRSAPSRMAPRITYVTAHALRITFSAAARLLAALLLAVIAMTSGCAAPEAHVDAAADAGDGPHRIYVVRHEQHTGIVIAAADIPAGVWPVQSDFAAAEYFEVGWGDRAYYMAVDPGIALGLRALARSTPGVLHVVAFAGPIEAFAAHEMLELRVSAQGLQRLLARIRDSHELDTAGRPLALGPGLYGNSRFYASRETFHLFRTCNVWTSALLSEAGVPAQPALLADALMAQLRPHGKVIRAAR